MADISNNLIKNTFDYVLQADIATGMVYRIGGQVPNNPIFSLGLTIEDTFTYSDGSEQPGYVLTCDAVGNATWSPVSGTSTGNYLYLTGGTLTGPLYGTIISATTISGGTFYGNGSNLTGIPDTFVTGGTFSAGTLTFTNNTGGTFSITGVTTGGNMSGDYLPLSGGTVTGSTTFTDGIYVDRIQNVDYIEFNTGMTPSSVLNNIGVLFFDGIDNNLAYFPDSSNDVLFRIGEQLYTKVYNASGSQINKGKVVSVTGTTYGLPSISLSVNTHARTSARPVGLAALNIPNNSVGYVLNNGILSGITLNTFANGATLYLSDTSPGDYVDSTSSLSFTARTNEIGYVIQTGTTTGKIYVIINNEDSNLTLTDIERNILEGNVVSTGAYEFSGITTASSTTINVAPMRGWVVKNTYNFSLLPDVISIYYSGGTNINITGISAADSTYILVNSASTLYQQSTFPTPQQRRENIFLGKVIHPNKTTIQNVNNTVDFDVSPMSALRDLWTPLKLVNQGIIPTAGGTNLTIKTSTGILWGNGINWASNELNPNSITLTGQNPATFQYRTATGGTFANTISADTKNYDPNGTGVVTPIPGSGNYTTQRIYLFPTGIIRIQYGQQYYPTLAKALAGLQNENFVEYPNNATNGVLIGLLTVKDGITDLSNTNDAVFSLVSKFGELLGGTAGTSTTTLQNAYDNSSTPEIVINSLLDGLSIKNGTGNADNVTNVLESVNSLSNTTAFIRADGTISGSTIYGNGANLFGLNYITGGTFNSGNKTLTITSATGQTINITGFTDTFVTGGTKTGSNVLFTNNTGGTFTVSGFTDTFVTGGTYSTGLIRFTNNSGGTFNVTGLTNTTNINFGSTGIVVDNTPNPITTGFKGSVTIPYSGTIVSWTILADQTGTVQLDIWNTTYAGYPGSAANSITGGNYITLTSQSKNTSSTLTGWTTTVSPGDILQWNVNSASTVNKITVTLNITKS